MKNTDKITVPLTGEEHSFLMTVYKKRRAILLKSFATFVPVMMIASVYCEEQPHWYQIDEPLWYEHSMEYYYYKRNIYFRHFFVGIGLFSAIAVYMNQVRIRSIKRDIVTGVKQKVPYIITCKQYFPMTNQYFIWTDKIDKPNHEVDEATHHNCVVGDTVYIYMAPKSKLLFEKDGKYEL
jgi:hypothetical protein